MLKTHRGATTLTSISDAGLPWAITSVPPMITSVNTISRRFEVRLRASWASHSRTTRPNIGVASRAAWARGDERARRVAARQQEGHRRNPRHDQADDCHHGAAAAGKQIEQPLGTMHHQTAPLGCLGRVVLSLTSLKPPDCRRSPRPERPPPGGAGLVVAALRQRIEKTVDRSGSRDIGIGPTNLKAAVVEVAGGHRNGLVGEPLQHRFGEKLPLGAEHPRIDDGQAALGKCHAGGCRHAEASLRGRGRSGQPPGHPHAAEARSMVRSLTAREQPAFAVETRQPTDEPQHSASSRDSANGSAISAEPKAAGSP